MSRTFEAILLLGEPFALDVDAIAQAARELFPQIGTIKAGTGNGRDEGLLTIDSAQVSLMYTGLPVLASELSPALNTLRTWNPDEVIREHRAQLIVSCGGSSLNGLDGAKAYAAACHFVAAAAAKVAPASAVFWRTGWALSEATAFVDGAKSLLDGRMPTLAWLSFATIVPKGTDPDTISGMVTYGLRSFIGRELELAPRPSAPNGAFRILHGVARQVMNKGVELTDGRQLRFGDDIGLTVRSRSFWLRRDVPAFVLVTDDAVVDRETLRPLETAPT